MCPWLCAVWCQWIIGNSLNITEDLFWIMSGRAQEVKETKMKRMEREEQEREAMVAQQQQQRADGSSTSNSNGASSVSTDSQQQGRKANLSREERYVSSIHFPPCSEWLERLS